jgi:hypothetical protein
MRLLMCHQIFRFDFEKDFPENPQLSEALTIIAKNYKKSGDADILECKAELIENGLSDYAKL